MPNNAELMLNKYKSDTMNQNQEENIIKIPMNLNSENLQEKGFKKYIKKPIPINAKQMQNDFEVKTLEGTMQGKKGDYLVIGIQGEPYPVAKKIFEESYNLK